MSKCIKCEAEIKEGSKFCEFCGAPQNENVVVQSSQNTDDVAQSSQNTNDMAQSSQESGKFDFVAISEKAKVGYSKIAPFIKKHKRKILIAVVVLVVIIAVAIVYDATHCNYSNCNNSRVSGSQYCYSHKCNICNRSKAYGSNYCYLHKTLYSSSGSTTTGSVYTDLKFSNIKIEHNSLYTVVTGTVTNTGSTTYKFVTVKGAFKNSAGTVIDTDSTYAVGSEGLAKGESKTFRMSINKNYSATKCDISIISYK